MNKLEPIIFEDNTLKLLDQRKLPHKEEYVLCTTLDEACNAIRDMVVRGAPCIGFSAIFSMALWVKNNITIYNYDSLKKAALKLKKARPTAVNLVFEVDFILREVEKINNSKEVLNWIINYGYKSIDQSELKNRQMANLVFNDLKERAPKKKYNILTHCNTGFLACGSIGTALGVIQIMHEENAIDTVYVDETRPYLQGSRLTAYELDKLNINYKVVVEGAASYLMKNKLIDAICVGADRIARNGDTANKIGTSNLSIIANHYSVPFYVIAPISSFDISLSSGSEIEIEQRDQDEILSYKESRIAPMNSRALNPSFDITDAKLITAISCEKNIFSYPYDFGSIKND